jgi:hypothetical protein
VINRRFQGVAEKNRKTHYIVLAKRTKDRVRSKKGLGWVCLQETNRSRGLSKDSPRLIISSKDYRKP